MKINGNHIFTSTQRCENVRFLYEMLPVDAINEFK